MGVELFVNDVRTTLATTTTTSATSLTLASGTGFPSPTGGDLTRLRLEPAAPDGTYEIVNMTARSGATLTVARAQEGTAGVAWPSGSIVRPVLTAASMTSFLQTVTYAGDVTVARPVAEQVTWVNFPTQPTNMLDGDLWLPPADAVYDLNVLLGPTGTIRATDNRASDGMSQSLAPVSGTLYLRLIYCYAGDTFTSLNIRSGAAWTGSVAHSWAVVADTNRVVLAASSDNTTAAQAAQTTRSFSLGGGWVAPSSGAYYWGVMIQGATTNPIVGNNGVSVGQQTIPPVSSGTSNTAQTTPPAVAATLTALTPILNLAPYIWGT